MKYSYLDFPAFLELKENDTVFFAADLSQMAKDAKANGELFSVNLFIEAFQKRLKNGTIIIPAYTDHLWNGDTFDYDTSKPTTGAISNKTQRRKDFIRSKDPLHSVFVWGKHQKEIVDLDGNSTFGEKSIFAFAHQVNAKMIIIDLHLQQSFTFIHYVEEQMKVRHRKPYLLKFNYIKNGVCSLKEHIFYTRRPGVISYYYDLQKKFIENNISKIIRFGNTEIQVIELKSAYEASKNHIEQGGKIYYFSLFAYLKYIAKAFLTIFKS
jgi:aminoglycoside 3-N-acetyltransferase